MIINRHHLLYVLGTLAFAMLGCTQFVWAQDSFGKLYSAETVRNQKVKSMTVELRAIVEGADTNQIAQSEPDYWERYSFDEQGRLDFYEATDVQIRRQGTPSPHIISDYEYSDNGRISHRHDSTAFARETEWHFHTDSLGRSLRDVLIAKDSARVLAERTYAYDARGRLDRTKYRRDLKAEGRPDDCAWVFYVHDSHSFNATSLSPSDMARCQCSLQYLDQGRKAREVFYDRMGNVMHTLLYNYDRTGKPIRVELRDAPGTKLHAWVDVAYGRNGVVSLDVRGEAMSDEFGLGRLSMLAQQFVIENWSGWRLLNELRLRMGGREIRRFSFSYDVRA